MYGERKPISSVEDSHPAVLKFCRDLSAQAKCGQQTANVLDCRLFFLSLALYAIMFGNGKSDECTKHKGAGRATEEEEGF